MKKMATKTEKIRYIYTQKNNEKLWNFNMAEPLNIPFIVDTTIRGGTFQTPILQDITHGQRKRSQLFHT